MARYKTKQSTNWGQDSENTKIVKQSKVKSEGTKEIKSFITILIVIIAIIVGIYFISKVIVDKRTLGNVTDNEDVAGEIDYTMASVGMILNRPYDEYYVMIYNSEDTEAIYYSSLITRYQAVEDSKKIFFTDLSNALNSDYAAETSNPKAQKIEDFAFGKVTLLHIKKSKVVKYIEDIKKIDELLK